KLDKIGVDGIKAELLSKGYAENSVTKLIENSDQLAKQGIEGIREICPEGYENMK
ncbi:MAG TPA: histidine--tRNA ligase, partial [Clostridiales bacterium UBA8960]|nr:histidine--tRNA ligase [Clostridiales bacterium UBA8960]